VPFHAGAGGGIASRPRPAGSVGGVDQRSGWIDELEGLAVVVEAAGVVAVGRDVGDRRVIRALQQIEAVGPDFAPEGLADIAAVAVGQAPSFEADGLRARVPQLDPLVAGRG